MAVPDLVSLGMAEFYPVMGGGKHESKRSMKKPRVQPEELAAIAEAVDDGFCPASALAPRFPRLNHRPGPIAGAAPRAVASSAAGPTGGSTWP